MADGSQAKTTFSDRIRSVFARDASSSHDFEADPGKKGFVITLCVLTACLLWFAFSMQEMYTQVISMPVEVTNLPDDQALISPPPTDVRVQIEGEGVQLLRLYYRPPTIPLNASTREQDMELITSETVKSVSIQGVTPRLITLATDERLRKRVPVRSRVRIDPATGHRVVGDPVIRPDSVWISGARSIVTGIDSWATEPAVIDDVRDTVRTVVALSDSLGRLLELSADQVTYRANVQEFTEDRRVLAVQVRNAPPSRRVSFNPPSVTVRYLVPLSQYDQAKESDQFEAFVPYSEIRSDTSGVLYPRLQLPEGLEIREPRIQPDALRYYNVLGDN